MPITVLANGMRLASARSSDLPVDAVGVSVRAGSAAEAEGGRGAAHLVEHLMLARREGARQAGMATAFDELGAQPTAATGKESTVYSVRILSSDLPVALRAFRGVLSRPDTPNARMDAEKRTVLAELAEVRQHSERSAILQAESELFRGTPLAHPAGGTPRDIADLGGEAVTRYWSANYRPANVDICVVGQRRHRELLPLVCDAFETEPATDSVHPSPAPRPGAMPTRSVVVTGAERDVALAPVVWSFPAPAAGDATRARSVVLAALLASGFSSLLVSELRIDNQLVYSPRAFYTGYSASGMLTVSASTRVEHATEVLTRIRGVLERIASAQISHRQFEYAIRHVSCSTQLAHSDQTARLRSLVSSMHYLGRDPRLDELRYSIRAVRSVDVALLAATLLETDTEVVPFAAIPERDTHG